MSTNVGTGAPSGVFKLKQVEELPTWVGHDCYKIYDLQNYYLV